MKKREELKNEDSTGVNQYYGIGAVLAMGVIGGLGYYIYQAKKGGLETRRAPRAEGPTSGEVNTIPNRVPQPDKFGMN